MNGLNLGISTFAQTGRAGADRGGAGLPASWRNPALAFFQDRQIAGPKMD